MPVKLPLPTSPTHAIRQLLPTSAPGATNGGCTVIYASHARWPLPRDPAQATLRRPLRISVVDSSFNPPHAAHLALAQHGDYDAHLLALTIANPDKGKIDEEAVSVRLEMMRAVARDLERRAAQDPDGKLAWANVAVAVLTAPTFTQKSAILRRDLDALAQEQEGEAGAEVRLTFAVGYDTLIRIFAPRYYQPPNPDLSSSMSAFLSRDDSRIACARRGDISPEEERSFLTSDEVRPWVDKVEMFDIADQAVQGISSTAIREAASAGRWDEVKASVPVQAVIDIMRERRMYAQETA